MTNPIEPSEPQAGLVEELARAIMADVFSSAQPDRGDVFSWLDDHASDIVSSAVLPIIDRLVAEARSQAIAEVVAWLRKGEHYGIKNSCGQFAADAIERGDHLASPSP